MTEQRNENDIQSEPALLPDLVVPPFWMIVGFILLVILTWVPLALIARARTTTSTQPRIHPIQDMDVQPKYGPQDVNRLFADNRAMRPPVPGTVARGELAEDDHFWRGYRSVREDGEWKQEYFDGLPAEIEISEKTARRGQRQFGVYCSPCHGLDGYGEGIVHRRAVERAEPAWIPPTSLHADTVRARPDGHLFNTITNGIRNMAGYGRQIDVRDRWAIVLYIRALQFSQAASVDDVPPDKRAELR